MPSAAKFWIYHSGSHAGSSVAAVWFLIPLATARRPYPASAPSTAVSNQSVMKQCGAQWQSAKAAGTTNGATWPQFLKDCPARLASTTSAPSQGGFAPAAPAPAPAPSPAPTRSGSLFPWQQPTAPHAGAPASTGGGSASPQEAQYRCHGSTVVWVNEHSHIYHFAGTRDYGNTKSGAYICEADAQAATSINIPILRVLLAGSIALESTPSPSQLRRWIGAEIVKYSDRPSTSAPLSGCIQRWLKPI